MPTAAPLARGDYPLYHVGDVRDEWIDAVVVQALRAIPVTYRPLVSAEMQQRMRTEICKALAVFLSRADVQAEVAYRVLREYDAKSVFILGGDVRRALAEARNRQP